MENNWATEFDRKFTWLENAAEESMREPIKQFITRTVEDVRKQAFKSGLDTGVECECRQREQLIAEAVEGERERIFAAMNADATVKNGGCDGCDMNVEMLERIRAIIRNTTTE